MTIYSAFSFEKSELWPLLVEKTINTGITTESVGTITDEFLKALKSWFNVRDRTFIGKTFFLKTVNNKSRMLRFCLIVCRFCMMFVHTLVLEERV